MIISIIAAVADNNVIGNKNSLPWYLPADLKHFKKTTTGHHIIMGQTTHESIGKALPDRTNIVLSLNEDYESEGCIVVHSIEEALRIASTRGEKEVFIIGGASIYKQTVDLADKLYITRIHYDFDGDVYFPKIDEKRWKFISKEPYKSDLENLYDYDFLIYSKS